VSGNTFIEESDVSLPGLGGGLKLRRTWNSMWAATQTTNQIGSFGLKWKSNYDERVYVGTDHFVKYATGGGDLWSFGRSSSGPGFEFSTKHSVLNLEESKPMAAAVEDKVKQIIVEQLGVDEGEVTPNASFVDDLGADSLDTVELVMAFEEAFDIEIPDEDAEKIQSVRDAYTYIDQHKAK